MKNCIFIDISTLDSTVLEVVSKEVNKFLCLLESILIYGNTGDDTVIVVYTSKEYKFILEKIHLCIATDKVTLEVNTVSKNSLFTRYQNVLFLDTSVIVKDDLSRIFNLCVDDVLYVLDKGIAFSSDVYMCKTSDLMLFLVDKIPKEEQYVSYNVFPDKLYGKGLITTDTFTILKENGDHYLNSLKDATIVENIKKTKEFIDTHLIQLIKATGELLEGNIFMIHHTTEYTDMFLNKAKNISNVVLNKELRKCMEIGFNSGFSALLMLISNPYITIDCFDLGEHSYTVPCYKTIKKFFGDRINITLGDSTKTVPLVTKKYQLIHIDGGHMTCVANSDIVNSYRLSNKGTVLIMDDYDAPNLKPLWDSYVEFYKLKPLHITLYRAPQHDIKYVL